MHSADMIDHYSKAKEILPYLHLANIMAIMSHFDQPYNL